MGLGNSVVVGRGVACEAPSARRAGGNERARQRGRSRARARRCPRKSLLSHQKSTYSTLHGQVSPPTHWTSVSLASFTLDLRIPSLV